MLFTGCLIACAFGTFGVGANGPNLYHNTLTLNTGPVCVATGINRNNYSAVIYDYKVVCDVDFRFDNSTNEIFMSFNDMKGYLSTYNSSTDSFDLVGSVTSWNDGFASTNLSEPRNTWTTMISVDQTSSYGTVMVRHFYSDFATRSSSGNTLTLPDNPLFSSNYYSPDPDNVLVAFDLDNLYSQVINAFNSQSGGYSAGYNVGYEDGYVNGTGNGYNEGYNDGYVEGIQTDSTAFTIFNGILGIGMLPINVFLAMLNWEVFGINISSFVMSIFTLAITIYVISVFTGKKDKK